MAITLRKGEIEDAYRDEGEDDASDEDMEAFRRACMLTGTNPSELNATTIGGNETTIVSDSDGDGSDLDDLELVRSIQQRFSIPSDNIRPLVLKPLRTLPPGASDDDEDDFETLRAIERRFAKYDSDALKRNTKCSMDKAELVSGSSTTLEQGVAKGLDEESPSSEEAPVTSQPRESFEDTDLGNQPSSSAEWHCIESFEAPRLPPQYSHFCNPKSAHMFIDAIKRNRSCQRFIRSKLIQIEARIEENKKLKERIKLIKDYQMSCRRRAGRALTLKRDPHIQLIQVRKLRNSQSPKVTDKKIRASYFGPVENSHSANYRMVLTKFLLSLRKQKWSKAEKENLGKGIKQQFQEMLLQKSLELLCFSEETSGDSHAFDDTIASITNLEIAPEKIRSFLPMVNWDRLASMYVVGRSGAECEARWLNSDDPLINHNSWTKTEDKNILFILQQRGLHNWIDIAISLGTNRTPFQCLARYQRSLNAFIMKRDWTEDDDTQLREGVEAFGIHDWQLVASNLEGRTGTQCSNRWNKTLNPCRERVGRWTVEEDKHLKVAVMLFGPKTWNKVAQFVPGRTQVQCRERWVNVLDPSLNLGEWTGEEDSKLKAAITEHGHCWSKVAACLPPRTDNQCRRRWKVLLPHEVPLLQAARRIQKAALISNFVDREVERPALGPRDFLPLPWDNSVSAAENGDGTVKNNKKTRAKPKPRKQKDMTCSDDASTKISSKRARTKARSCSQEVSREMNGDVESLGRGDTIPKKKRGRKPRLKDECTESVAGNQDLQLFSEPSIVSRINSSHDDNIIRDFKDCSKNKERKSNQRRKRGKFIDTKQEHRDRCPSLSADNSNSLRIPDEDDVEIFRGVAAYSKRRKVPQSLSKYVRCNKSAPNHQGSSLSPEDTTTLLRIPNGHDAETFGIYNTSQEKRKVSMSRSREGKNIVPAIMRHDLSLHEEQSVINSMDVTLNGVSTTANVPTLNGVSTTANVPSEDRLDKLTKDIPHSEETETIDEDTATLASYLLNKGRKKNSEIAKKNKAALRKGSMPCSRKGKITKAALVSQDLLTHEEQSAFTSMDIASNGVLITTDIPADNTSENTKYVSRSEDNLETKALDCMTLASFLVKKGNKRRFDFAKNDEAPLPTGRKKAHDFLSQENSSAQFAEDLANLQFLVDTTTASNAWSEMG